MTTGTTKTRLFEDVAVGDVVVFRKAGRYDRAVGMVASVTEHTVGVRRFEANEVLDKLRVSAGGDAPVEGFRRTDGFSTRKLDCDPGVRHLLAPRALPLCEAVLRDMRTRGFQYGVQAVPERIEAVVVVAEAVRAAGAALAAREAAEEERETAPRPRRP